MGKSILVTGAAGFIGYHLAGALHARGDAVVGFDNFNTYYSEELKRARATDLAKRGITVLEGDICDMDTLARVVRERNITHIAHLAAQAGVRYSLKHPRSYLKANIDGFHNILEVCRDNPHIKLTYASSSSVYGLNDKVPFKETDRTDRQASLYGATKKSGELFASTYHHLFGLSVTGLRYFSVYGPWGRPDMSYHLFTEAILAGKPIEVFNFGNMQRDFTYIDDIIEGTVAAIDNEGECELFNLGNNHPVALMEMIQTLEELLGKKAEKKLSPMQPGDIVATYADISHSEAVLGFSPKTPLRKGLETFVAWYKAFYL